MCTFSIVCADAGLHSGEYQEIPTKTGEIQDIASTDVLYLCNTTLLEQNH